MRVVDHAARHFHILFEGRRRLAVFLQRAVHHHRGVAQFDGALAGLKAVAVILVHGDGNVGIQLGRRLDQLEEVEILGKRARAAAGLHDHRRLGLPGRHHDGLNLLHVVHVERADAVSALGSFIEELPHGNKRHKILLLWWLQPPVRSDPSAQKSARRREPQSSLW